MTAEGSTAPAELQRTVVGVSRIQEVPPLDRLEAHDGTDLGLVVVPNESNTLDPLSEVPKTLLAYLEEPNSVVRRKIVLKRYVPLGEFSTGLEPEHWKRASECKDFVLPYLGNVTRKVALENTTSLWLASPYMHVLDKVIAGCDTDQYRPFLRQDRVLGYLSQLLSGLEFLHNVSRLVHCDFKPDNVYLTETFEAVIGVTRMGKTR
ncbi:hypothetical protein AURDEDRAFT_173874 [Auricularia subglabra TFB-10046 SS5]|uniref:Protein kinase domain-containing protein n=1 Tax=Auricularia subglabra (strain TFB-10046 / SS5) TaxID=717982 RepID=J0WVK2_AURST|nr:hypothetical protein AURDEDRAFT_173874 [Auricularia subglabra TFB-10046 SS5]